MSTAKRLDPYADRGADGQAMMSRPFVIATVEDDTAGEDGTRRFTRTEVKRVQDGVIEWCAAKGWLDGYRLDAARDLATLYAEGRNSPTGYSGSGGGGGEMSDARAEAWREYCDAIDALPHRCRSSCEDVARGCVPADANACRNVPDGFAVLVTYWRLGPRQSA